MRRSVLLAAPLLMAATVSGPAAGDDRGGEPTCYEQPATITGTGGPDQIRGTNGDDVIVTGSGFDVVRARGGNDLV